MGGPEPDFIVLLSVWLFDGQLVDDFIDHSDLLSGHRGT